MVNLFFAMVAVTALQAFMSGEMCEVVTVKGPDGEPLRVNKSDFDPETMELFDPLADASVSASVDPAVVAPASVDPAVAAQPVKLLVGKEGTGVKTRFFVVDETGAKVTREGIEAGGYSDEKLAWDAIMALPR